MWSFRVAILAAVAVIAACGFRPLHAPGGGAVPATLSGIEIAPISDRLGQVVRNHLLDRLTPRGAPSSPRYRIVVSLRVTKEGLAIARDETATRFNVSVEADYELLRLPAGESVLQGVARSIAAYNVVSSDYATLVAERDAELRAAREISDELKTRVAVYLSQSGRS